MKHKPICCALALAMASLSTAEATTLDDVRARGYVKCGVGYDVPGFSASDDRGRWAGLDVETCRAVAAAVFGDPDKVRFTALQSKVRFTALQSGEVDLLVRQTTWTLKRDTVLGFKFTGVNFYDGTGFMLRKSLGVSNARQLAGASICITAGTTTELAVADWFRNRNMTYEPVTFEKADEAIRVYESGRCDAYASYLGGAAGHRLKFAHPQDHIFLPEIISKEPCGPVVRQGDDQWFNIVRWVLFAMVDAEELGITSGNAWEMRGSNNPKIRHLLGLEGDFGVGLGLDNDWAYNIIKTVGNYGEVFARTLGPDTPIGLPRGLNRLWTEGGVMYAPPIR
ncbi:MAG: amino acid ABC transporter substrate-binding protein [Hyphomicrobiales bacterium]